MGAVDLPPFQLQRLIPEIINHTLGVVEHQVTSASVIRVCCVQGLGSDIYVGCSNGDVLRFGLQPPENSDDKLQSYVLLSGQCVAEDKPIEEIVIVPSLSRAFIRSEQQIYFHALPSLDPLPIKPIRNILGLAVDDTHLKRPPHATGTGTLLSPTGVVESIDFCVIKRTAIGMYTFSSKDRLGYIRELNLPEMNGPVLCKRTDRTLCIADKEHYHLVNLKRMTAFPLLPISQAPDPPPFEVKPSITVVGPGEYLLLSWMGTSALGLFINGNGDPVRGTLQWESHPEAICLDYPHIISLLPNNTIQIHNIETQEVVQDISCLLPNSMPSSSAMQPSLPSHRRQSSSASSRSMRGAVPSTSTSTSAFLRKVVGLISTNGGGYVVPSTQKWEKMRKVGVPLLRS